MNSLYSSDKSCSLQLQRTLAKSCSKDLLACEQFLRSVIESAEVGYVLYGNKPICFISANSGYANVPGKMTHHLSAVINKGIKVWKKLGLPKRSKNFIFHSSDYVDNETCVVFINLKAYESAFKENAILFQYILGPKVTADKLLDKLLNPKENFFSCLKNNKVLAGILLGFGTENSLLVSREETIREFQISPKRPPFKTTYKNDILETALVNQNPSGILLPSFGYESLEEESDDLDKEISMSSDSLEKYAPRLYFGCKRDSQETKKLIKNYEDTQVKIIQALNSDNFLENILNRFYDNEN